MTTLRREGPGTTERGATAEAGARGGPGRSLWAVLAVGAVSLLGTAWFAWSLPTTASRRDRQSVPLADGVGPWTWLYDHAVPPASPDALGATLALVTLAMVAAWVGMIALTWHRSSTTMVRAVVGLAALGAVISLLALPNQTSDIYDYVLFGRVAAAHDAQPYQDVPDAFPEDPTYPYSSHQYTGRPDNKLPVWTLTAIGAAEVAGDSPLPNLIVFRALLASASVATTALIAWILGRIRPSAAASGAAIFGLCPTTLVYGTSKTDSLMVLLMVAALALVVVGRSRLATAACTLAVLVKLIAAPVLALLVLLPTVADRQKAESAPAAGRWWGQAQGAAGRALIAVAVIVLVYLPYRDPVALARDHLLDSGDSSAASAFHPVTVAAFVLVLAAIALHALRLLPTSDVDRARRLVSAAAPVLVVFAVLLTRPGLPWYLLTPLAIVALARSVPLLAVLGTVSASSFLLGWWDSIDTREHPLPELHDASRPQLYLLVALAATLAAVAARLHTRRADSRLRGRGRRRWGGRGDPHAEGADATPAPLGPPPEPGQAD